MHVQKHIVVSVAWHLTETYKQKQVICDESAEQYVQFQIELITAK